ncbi:MAG: hypothetical protein R6U98_35100 [Pirellulaceae bacterium]
MEYVGGTRRPSARRVMEFLWDEIVLAVDVCPESCEERRDEQDDTQEKSQGASDPANQRRGPPTDPQGRLAFAAS